MRIAASVVLTVLSLMSWMVPAGEPDLKAPLKDEELQKIVAASPDKPSAAPKKPRKVLCFWKTPGFKHTVIPCTNAAVETLGKKTGAYQTVISDDPAMFETAKLAEFDAVILNNTCGANVKIDGKERLREIFITSDILKLPADQQKAALQKDEELKKNFEAFVKGGKGLVGIHGASGAFHSWPAFGDMLGALFKWHPAPFKAKIKLDDPKSPLLAAFGGNGFEIKEECYVVGDPFSREKVHVLLTIETTEPFAKNPRPDGDYAMAWIKRYGEGRVFYNAFSHFDETFKDPKMLRFLLDGIQFAIGDLEADASPSGKK